MHFTPAGAPGITTLTAAFAGKRSDAGHGFHRLRPRRRGAGSGGLVRRRPRPPLGRAQEQRRRRHPVRPAGQGPDRQHRRRPGPDPRVTGLIRNPAKAKQVVVPLALVGDGSVAGGDVLRVRVSTRIGTTPQGARCAGPGGSHVSARGLRLYYDSAKMPSNLGLQLSPDALENFFLDSDGGDLRQSPQPDRDDILPRKTAPGPTAPKCRDSGTVNFANGNPWQLIGTWSLPYCRSEEVGASCPAGSEPAVGSKAASQLGRCLAGRDAIGPHRLRSVSRRRTGTNLSLRLTLPASGPDGCPKGPRRAGHGLERCRLPRCDLRGRGRSGRV